LLKRNMVLLMYQNTRIRFNLCAKACMLGQKLEYEVFRARPPLWNVVLQNEAANADEDLEHFEDCEFIPTAYSGILRSMGA
ncbi:UNVERIFIED_CONTAM: hypothetical protein Sindi_0732700, partial [Sesamum indicum]